MGPAFVANSSRNFVMSTTSFVLTPTLFKLYYPQEQKSQVLVAAQSRVSLSLFVLLTAACAPVDAILVRAGVQHLRRQRRSDHAASAVGPSPRLRRAERRPENQLPRCCQGGSGEGRLGGVFHAGEVVCPRPHERPRPRSARQHSMSCPGCQLQQYWLPTPGARTALDKMLLKQAPSRGSTTRSFPLPSRR